jgi:hypothetical protein
LKKIRVISEIRVEAPSVKNGYRVSAIAVFLFSSNNYLKTTLKLIHSKRIITFVKQSKQNILIFSSLKA